MALLTAKDGLSGFQFASAYTAGGGVFTLGSGQAANFPSAGGYVYAVTAAVYQTSTDTGAASNTAGCLYTYSGVSGNTLTGVTAVSGFTDRNFAIGDIAEQRATAEQLNTLATLLNSLPAGNVIGNGTNAAATATQTTISSIIDNGIASTQGDTLYRGSSAWSALAPGTNGQFLQTQGSAANPQWASPINTGTLGQISYYAAAGTVLSGAPNFGFDTTNSVPQFTPISDPGTPAAGDMWQSSTDNSLNICRSAGLYGRLPQLVFSCGACNAVTGTSFASLLGSPTSGRGSLTIPANTLKVGSILRWIATFSYTSASGSPTFSMQILLGSSTILGFYASATLAAAKTGGIGCTSQIPYYAISTIGSSATGGGVSIVTFNSTGSTSATCYPGGATPVATSTFNSTVSNLFDIQGEWSTGTGCSANLTSLQLYLD